MGLNQITIAQDGYIEDGTNFYFLSEVTKNRGNGDSILLENNGKFGLIDTGSSATQLQVIQYLQQKGVKQLEFMLITHFHSDHMGAALKIMQTFPIKTLYLKEYNEDYVETYKGNQTNYNNIIQLAQKKNIKTIGVSKLGGAFHSNNTKFTFGTAKIQILNWETKYNSDGTRKVVKDENENSLAILVTQGNKKAFLSGDMNDILGDETRLAPIIGKVDFLKLAHHGYMNSNTENFLKTLKPEYAVITNDWYKPYVNTIRLLEELKTKYHYSTQDQTAVIVKMTDNNVQIKYENPDGWKFIMGKWRYIKNGVELTEKLKEEATASSWEELSKIIAKGGAKRIKLKNSNEWIANKQITISHNQQITLTTEESIQIVRAENYKGALLENKGILDIGQENMKGSITIDGNKQKVNAIESMLNNTGTLNISNKVTLSNNKLLSTNTTNGSAISSTGLYNQVNISGGIIENNEVIKKDYLEYDISLNQKNKIEGIHGGAIYIEEGALNIVGGSIRKNRIDNHSTITIREDKIKELKTTTYGAAIFGSNAILNLIGTNIENNSCENHSNINVQNSTIDYVNATAKGGAIAISEGKLNISNNTTIKSNQAKSNTKLINSNTKINTIETEKSCGGAIYGYKSTIKLNQTNMIKNQAVKENDIFLAKTELIQEETNIGQYTIRRY